MRFEPERVYYQQIEPFEAGAGLIRDDITIGNVGEAADLERGHRQAPVYHRKRLDLAAEQWEFTLDGVRYDPGDTRIGGGLECIGVDTSEPFPGDLAGIAIDWAVAKHDRPGIVEAEAMVGMGMGEQDCIDVSNSGGQGLLPEVG